MNIHITRSNNGTCCHSYDKQESLWRGQVYGEKLGEHKESGISVRVNGNA
ncbi:hypothetical protein [Kineobactrum sediminis]|nr:hypothetical protein [Kineobactrum sediminis]